MRRTSRGWHVGAVVLGGLSVTAWLACRHPDNAATGDAGGAGPPADAPIGVPIDARIDAPADAQIDAPVDARIDAPVDARIDARIDAPADAPIDAHDPDASPDALPATCDPIAQTGCAAGAKCTWIIDADGGGGQPAIGHVGCAPAGSTADGAACAAAQANVNGGADSCIAGDLCAGTCKPICGLSAVSGPGACSVNHACIALPGVFTSSGVPTAGVCQVTCDPLTQRLSGTATEACGSLDPSRPTGTCVPTSGEFRAFVCAPVIPGSIALTDRTTPLGDQHGPFGNGCAPGFLPFYFEDASGAMKTLCSGMCAPAKVDAEIAVFHPELHAGDPSARGKLVADTAPVAGHATCLQGVKGSIAPDAQGNGVEDCRFLWFPLAAADPTKVGASPYGNTLGFCFDYRAFITVDTNGDGRPDAAEKSCAQLPVTATAGDPFGTAEENGCYPLPGSPGRQAPRRRASYRPGYAAGPLVRPVLE